LLQSAFVLQPCPVPQCAHTGPPQSIADSCPFFTPSTQVGAWQRLPVHTPLPQSAGPPHDLLGAQRGQPGVGVGPPQSMSLSPWFFTPSPHVAVWHFFGAPVQTRLTQSAGPPQSRPSVQAGQELPQSLSVSVPFFTPSEHVGAWHFFGFPLQTPLVQSVVRVHV
jgi:hypothetical protein